MTGATAERAPQRHEDDEPGGHEPGGMTRAERTANLIGVVVPFLGLLAAVVLLWNSWVDGIDLAIMAVTYMLFGFGVTIGYHRLLTHRAFQTHKPIEYLFAVLGSMGLQGSVLDWVADHRKHHAHADQEGDPHSPHVGHGSGLSGLWHAHTGWLFETHGQADWKRYATELYEDRGMRRINKAFPWLALAEPRHPDAARLGAARLHARGRAARPGLGRPRARVLPAPRDVVDQLGLPLLRPPPLRDRGPLDQRRCGSRCRRSARPGTTTTTRSRARPRTGCAGGSSTRPAS